MRTVVSSRENSCEPAVNLEAGPRSADNLPVDITYGADLANRTNEENQKLYDRMIETMLNKLGYCTTCAQKTIEYFCTQVDEN